MAEHQHDDKATDARTMGERRPHDATLNASADAPVVPDAGNPRVPAGTNPPGAEAEGATTPGDKIAEQEREQAEDASR